MRGLLGGGVVVIGALIFSAAAFTKTANDTFKVQLPARGNASIFVFKVSWPVKSTPHFGVGTLSGASTPSWSLRGAVVITTPVRHGAKKVEAVYVAISNLASAGKQHLNGPPATAVQLFFEGLKTPEAVSQQKFDHNGCARLKAVIKLAATGSIATETTAAQPLPGLVIGAGSRLKTVQDTIAHDSDC